MGDHAERLEAEARRALAAKFHAVQEDRDVARGWVRWLVRQAKDDRFSLAERVSIVAHFPVDEYPPHPAEAQLQAANIREQGMREALEPFATIAENFKGCGAPDNETCAIKFGLTYGDFRRAREALRPRDQEDPRPAIEGADDRNV